MNEVKISEEKSPKSDDRPRWSMLTCFYVAIVILLIATVSVLLLMKKPVWVELETLAALTGVIMTLFYSYVLYNGVYFNDKEKITFNSLLGKPADFIEGTGHNLSFGTFTAEGASEGPVGLILGLILDVIVCLFLAFILGILLWVGVNIVFVSILMIAIPFFYVFQRSLLFVMKHVEECHMNFWCSLRYGLFYGAFKTGIICTIIYCSHKLALYIKTTYFF